MRHQETVHECLGLGFWLEPSRLRGSLGRVSSRRDVICYEEEGACLLQNRLVAQWYPLPFFCLWFPFCNSQPKKGALIIIWLMGYHDR